MKYTFAYVSSTEPHINMLPFELKSIELSCCDVAHHPNRRLHGVEPWKAVEAVEGGRGLSACGHQNHRANGHGSPIMPNAEHQMHEEHEYQFPQ